MSHDENLWGTIGNGGQESQEGQGEGEGMEFEHSHEEGTSFEGEGGEMELSLDDEELGDMEKIVDEKIEESEKKVKGKKGKKAKEESEDGEEAAEKEEKPKAKEKVDLTSGRILEREIKKGNVFCAQGRIEKTDEGDYRMLLADEITTRTKDLEFKEVGRTAKLNDGKWEIALLAKEKFGDKFVHMDGDKAIKHDTIRVELHKPGRDKDVVETYSLTWAQSQAKSIEDKKAKREADAAKKAEREKAAKEAEEAAAATTEEAESA